MSKVLCVAVHPDDETLGCGGAMLKHKAAGDEINWLILTNVSESDGFDQQRVVTRIEEIKKVAALYGFNKTVNCEFPTTKLDTIPMNELITKISNAIDSIKPELIYLPNRSDIHSDHKIAFQAMMSCSKNFRYPFIKRMLMYETLSETEFAPALEENAFVPNVFIDISDHFEKKIEIMQVYASEVMEPPLPRSLVAITALAQLRGSRIGKNYAEAFVLLQEIA